jgi:uncharacterized Zn-finger protein
MANSDPLTQSPRGTYGFSTDNRYDGVSFSFTRSVMTHPVEIIPTDTAKVSCDGDKNSPHPRVFLTVGAKGFVDCGYCGKRYALKAGEHADAH